MAIKNHIAAILRFFSDVLKNFNDDDCTYRASALTFTSLLAIVPLLSVIFSIFAAFPVFKDALDPLQNFIFENFVPETGKVVQSYLLNFTSQASKLSIFGISFSFVTAVLLMYTIEKALNKIWKVVVPRKGTAAFLLYWSILSLAPVLMGLSIAVSSYLISLPLINQNQAFDPNVLIQFAPFILSFLGFTLLYTIVPNCKVQLRHSMPAAFIATILFEAAKIGFSFYLSRFNTYQLLYGAFATVPLFFLWVYWIWLITLLCAEVAYCLSTYQQRKHGQTLDEFSHALFWLYLLWDRRKHHQGLTSQQLIKNTPFAFRIRPERLLSLLIKKRILKISDDNQYLINADLKDMSIFDLYQQLGCPFSLLYTTKSFFPLCEFLNSQQEKLSHQLNLSIDCLFSKLQK